MLVLPEHQRLMYKATNLFLQTILNEDKKVKDLHLEDVKKTTENPRIRKREDTNDICKELKEAKRDYVVSTQRRLQLRENNVELRHLIHQLRSANVCRQMVEQKLAADKAKEGVKHQKRLDDLEYEKERKRNLELMQKQELEENQRKKVFREGLLQQINHRIDMKKEEYKELLKDREDMKKVLESFEEERKAEQRALEIYRSRCRDEVLENTRLQELRKQRELSEKIDESGKFVALTKERDRLNMETVKRRRQDLERRQAISEEMGLNVQKIKNDKIARENLLLELLVEERIAKEEFRFQKNLEKLHEERMRVRQELLRFAQDSLRKKELKKEDNQQFLEMQANANLEYDSKVAAVTEKRRLSNEDHKRSLLEIIEVKRQERINARKADLYDHNMRMEAQRKEQEDVEDERIRILVKERPENLRYLPVGVLRKTDEKFLNLSFLKRFKFFCTKCKC